MNISRGCHCRGKSVLPVSRVCHLKEVCGAPCWLAESLGHQVSPGSLVRAFQKLRRGRVSSPHHVTFKMCCGGQKPTAGRAATLRDCRLGINTRVAFNCCKKQPRGSDLMICCLGVEGTKQGSTLGRT